MGYGIIDGIRYPDGEEDVDIPGDLQQMAEDVAASIGNRISSNYVSSVTLEIDTGLPAGTGEATISNGHLDLRLPNVAASGDLITNVGGTFVGNVSFGAGAALSVNEPTAAVHAASKQYVDTFLPVGTILMFAGTTVPTGWTICDGRVHGSSALQTLLGSANTPDLKSRFVMGAASAGELRTFSGSNTATLAITNIPQHDHTLTGDTGLHKHTITVVNGSGSPSLSLTMENASTDHVHGTTVGTESSDHYHGADPGGFSSGGGGGHNHNQQINAVNDSIGVAGLQDQSPNYHKGNIAIGQYNDATGWGGDHTHWIDIPYFNTGWRSHVHNHAVTLGGQSANASHKHTISGSVNIAHGHTATSADASTGHSHTVGKTGSGTAFSIVPAHYKVYYIIYGGR